MSRILHDALMEKEREEMQREDDEFDEVFAWVLENERDNYRYRDRILEYESLCWEYYRYVVLLEGMDPDDPEAERMKDDMILVSKRAGQLNTQLWSLFEFGEP